MAHWRCSFSTILLPIIAHFIIVKNDYSVSENDFAIFSCYEHCRWWCALSAAKFSARKIYDRSLRGEIATNFPVHLFIFLKVFFYSHLRVLRRRVEHGGGGAGADVAGSIPTAMQQILRRQIANRFEMVLTLRRTSLCQATSPVALTDVLYASRFCRIFCGCEHKSLLPPCMGVGCVLTPVRARFNVKQIWQMRR